MYRKIKFYTMIGIVSIVISSCAASSLSVDNVNTLRPGITTKEEAISLLGPTNTYSNFPDGSVLIQWMEISPFRGFHVAILFDRDGRMIRVHHLSEN